MTRTIQAALSPLLMVGSLCGLGLIEYPLGQIRPYITCLYLLTMWSFFAYIAYYLPYTDPYILTQFINLDNTIILLTGVGMILASLFRYKELKICLDKLSIVDDTLEMLGTLKAYRRLYKLTIQMIIGWIVIAQFLNSLDIFAMNLFTFEYVSIGRICAPFVPNSLLHINTLSGLIWGTILKYTSSRFQKVNDFIKHLLESDTKYINRQNKLILLIGQRRIEARECRQYMWIIMHVHLQLCVISRELNKVFSIQMTLLMTCYFGSFLELYLELYSYYINTKTSTFEANIHLIFLYIWITTFGIKTIILNHICENVCNKTKETQRILYQLLNEYSDNDLREQIVQFILQINQRRVQFSGMGLFYFGYKFIRKFYLTVVTITVIMTQLGITESYDGISVALDKNAAES